MPLLKVLRLIIEDIYLTIVVKIERYKLKKLRERNDKNMLNYSIDTLQKVLNVYEQNEDYEMCKRIKKAIDIKKSKVTA